MLPSNTVIELKENPNITPLNHTYKNHSRLYRVLIIDNDYNTYQEVIDICMRTLNIDTYQAYRIALAVDHNGEAELLQAHLEEAERVANLIRTIGIEVRVLPV